MKTKQLAVLLVLLASAIGLHAQFSITAAVTNNLFEPYGIGVGLDNTYYITCSGDNTVKAYNPTTGSLTNLAGTAGVAGTNDGPGASALLFNPQGCVYVPARGGLVIADSGNNRIRFINGSATISTIAGSVAGNADGPGSTALFRYPTAVTADSAGNIYVADLSNGSVRRIDLTNGVTTIATGLVRPAGIAVDSSGNVYVSDTGNNSIRKISGGTMTLIAGTGSRFSAGLVNNAIGTLASFNAPRGLLWVGGKTGLLVADTGNKAIRQLVFNSTLNAYSVTTYAPFAIGVLSQPESLAEDNNGNIEVTDDSQLNTVFSILLTAPQPPITNPQIGTVTLVTDPTSGTTSAQMTFIQSATFNNDVDVAILAESGTETFFTLDPTANFPDDPTTHNSPPAFINDQATLPISIVDSSLDGPIVIIRAISTGTGRTPSALVSAEIVFQVGDPSINGDNPANFTVSDVTDESKIELWYTTDGSSPTNGAPSTQYTPGTSLNILNGTNDVVFKIQGYRQGYQPSSVSTKTFLFANLQTSSIGLTHNFVGGPGATVILPILVKLSASDILKSMQFRLDVIPNGTAPGLTADMIHIPITTNDFVQLPVISTNLPTITTYTSNTTRGIAVSYLGQRNDFSISGQETVALIGVPIPAAAPVGASYKVALVQPSGTSDGLQSQVLLSALSPVTLTVTNTSYVVGDSSPGTFYNAGDFGNHDLNNNDVNNAFYASLGFLVPPTFSDVYDSMDAYPLDTAGAAGGDGLIRFLDWQVILNRSLRLDVQNWTRTWTAGGVLADSTTTLTSASATPGQKGAVRIKEVNKETLQSPGDVWYRQAVFTTTPPASVAAGSVATIPVHVKVRAGSSLTGLQFRATVVAEDGGPAISGVSFIAASGLSAPNAVPASLLPTTDVAVGWPLGAFSTAITSDTVLGKVSFTVPANASGHTYSVHFSHVDGAPSLAAQYDLESIATPFGVDQASSITPSVTSDEWKIAFFGSINNPKAADNADPDGDGVPNWQEYLAGTNPNDASSVLKLTGTILATQTTPQGISMNWLTASGRGYVIETTSELGTAWTQVSSQISGNGRVQTFTDTNLTHAHQFYRVRLVDQLQ